MPASSPHTNAERHAIAPALRVLAWVPASVWACVIFGFSAIPGSNIPGHYGSLAHFTEYAILGVLVAWPMRSKTGTAGAVLLAISIAAGYAATDELHQAFVPLRTPDVVDWLVDTAGATVGAIAFAAATWVLAFRRQ